MPELPEVETIARQIRKDYLGRTLHRVRVLTARLLQNVSASEFVRRLENRPLKAVGRRGKFLLWQLGEQYLVFHLGMSGNFFRRREQATHPEHIHLEFYFAGDEALFYQDVRKFGKIWLYDRPPEFPALGVEPLSENFSLNNLKKLLNLKNMNIKAFLMDQKYLAGIGNIYANEILFLSRISPFRKTREITEEEAEELFRAIRFVLERAVENFGTTYSDFRTVEGSNGRNQFFLQVYQRADEPCPICGTPLKKVVLNSRSTFFCPQCQR